MYHERASWLLDTRAWTNACGWGTDNAASEATRSGWRPATYQASAAPQSCPARWKRSAPAASASASTSSASSEFRYAARAAGRAPGE